MAVHAGFTIDDGKRPFILAGWVQEKVAGLNERQKRLLDEALARFKDEAQEITERNDGTLQFEYFSSGGTASGARSALYGLLNADCKVALQLDGANNAEVIRISISRQSDRCTLDIGKANRSVGRPQEPASARQYAALLRTPAISINLTPAEEVRIRNCRGSVHTMESLQTQGSEILARGFSRTQLLEVAMSAHGGPSLDAMLTEFDTLRARGFTHEEIAAIAARGGRPALDMLASEACAKLARKGFTRPEIFRIAAMAGGAKAMQIVLGLYDRLTARDIAHASIVRIASKLGGAQALQALNNSYQSLRGIGFEHGQIVAIAETRASAQALHDLVHLAAPMRDAGLSHVQIATIATCDFPRAALQAIAEHGGQLRAQGFSAAQIVRLASYRRAADTIRMVRLESESYRSKGLTHAHIVEIGARSDAVNALKLINAYDWQDKLAPAELCALLAHRTYPERVLQQYMALRDQGVEKNVILGEFRKRHRVWVREAIPGPSDTASARCLKGDGRP